MSRWSEQFKSHPFRNQWNALKNLADTIHLTDETVKTDVDELARLRKVIKFVDALLEAADPELLPQNLWDQFNNQAQACVNELNNYVQNRNIGHMQGANNNLDNILSYVRPYIVSEKTAAQAASRAFNEYAATVTKQIDFLKSNTQQVVSDIQDIKNQATDAQSAIVTSKNSIQEFEGFLFNNTSEGKGLKERIAELFEESKNWHSTISGYLEKLTKGNDQESSIIVQIDKARIKALDDSKEISAALKSAQEEIDDLSDFHIKVFGEEKEDGKVEGGLKKELETRLMELEEFKTAQQKAYSTLYDKIDSLLPGATSAGLATAYNTLKDESQIKVNSYTKIFYSSLLGLFIIAAIPSFKIGGESWIEFLNISEPLEWLKVLIYKLPLLAPLLWLILFSSKRRSEFQRLQQEYAHKEALARSYHSFKMQIEALNEKDGDLMKQLLESAIKAISFNPSKTLDGKHGDKFPIQEIIENTIKKTIDAAKLSNH